MSPAELQADFLAKHSITKCRPEPITNELDSFDKFGESNMFEEIKLNQNCYTPINNNPDITSSKVSKSVADKQKLLRISNYFKSLAKVKIKELQSQFSGQPSSNKIELHYKLDYVGFLKD